jgi:2-methylcitrate dehydratase PrpD
VTFTPEVTKTLARYIISASYEKLPEKVRQEGVRTLLNWVGVAVGGSRHETVNIAVGALAPFSGPAQATILGRRERFDIMNAAFVNGVSSHIFDFDDTHLKTIIHPAGPVVSAILALTEYHPDRRRQRERQENDWKQTFSVHAKISIVPRSTHD